MTITESEQGTNAARNSSVAAVMHFADAARVQTKLQWIYRESKFLGNREHGAK